jgi:hypothetical protein
VFLEVNAMGTRLRTVRIGNQQLTLDVPSGELVLYDGVFVDPSTAPAITLAAVDVDASFTPFGKTTAEPLTIKQQRQVAICSAEDIPDSEVQPSPIVIAPDPSDGECICGITCAGTNLRYVQVVPVTD